MAVAGEAGQENRRQGVPRPPWVRQRSPDHAPLLGAFMLALVLVGLLALFLSGQLVQIVAPRGLLLRTEPVVPDRPVQGVVTSPDAPDAWAARWGTNSRAAQAPGADTAEAAAPGRVTEPAGPVDGGAATEPPGAVAQGGAPDGPGLLGEGGESDRPTLIGEPPALEPTAAAPTVTPAPTATPAATATVTVRATPVVPTPAIAAATGERARVVKTDGRGVVLYSAPRKGARQPAGLLEGTVVSILERSGTEWARVTGARKTGWVRTEFLAPAE